MFYSAWLKMSDWAHIYINKVFNKVRSKGKFNLEFYGNASFFLNHSYCPLLVA